jgi:hypothetical protein
MAQPFPVTSSSRKPWKTAASSLLGLLATYRSHPELGEGGGSFWKSEPEISKGMTKAIKRCRGISAPLASSMTEITEETLPESSQGRMEEREQESIGKGSGRVGRKQNLSQENWSLASSVMLAFPFKNLPIDFLHAFA